MMRLPYRITDQITHSEVDIDLYEIEDIYASDMLVDPNTGEDIELGYECIIFSMKDETMYAADLSEFPNSVGELKPKSQ